MSEKDSSENLSQGSDLCHNVLVLADEGSDFQESFKETIKEPLWVCPLSGSFHLLNLTLRQINSGERKQLTIIIGGPAHPPAHIERLLSPGPTDLTENRRLSTCDINFGMRVQVGHSW